MRVQIPCTRAIAITICSLLFAGCTASPPVTSVSNKPTTDTSVTPENEHRIAAGLSHNLMVNGDGSVSVWGGNRDGQSLENEDLYNVISVAAFNSHNLALKADGTVISWGYSYNDMTPPQNLDDAVAIDVGGNGAFAVKENGDLVYWGRDSLEELPDELAFVVSVSAGASHQLALNSDGTVVAWGNNSRGQSQVPEELTNQIGAIAVAAGDYHSLALLADGTVKAWGSNAFGQIDIPEALTDVTSISAGSKHSLALKSDGTLVAWGEAQTQSTALTNLTDIVAIAAGGDHSIAMRGDSSLVVWGNTSEGQASITGHFVDALSRFEGWSAGRLGLSGQNLISSLLNQIGGTESWGNELNYILPEDFGQIEKISTGVEHFLALNTDGEVFSWPPQESITQLENRLEDIIDIASTFDANYALRSDGIIVSWNTSDNNTEEFEIALPEELTDVIDLSSEAKRMIALQSDGTVIITSKDSVDAPYQTEVSMEDAVAISSGLNYSLGLTKQGSVVLLGENPPELQEVPTDLTDVIAIASGKAHNLALRRDGSVAVWGENIYGSDDFIEKHIHELQDIVEISAYNDSSYFTKADGSTFVWGSVYIPSSLNIDITKLGE